MREKKPIAGKDIHRKPKTRGSIYGAPLNPREPLNAEFIERLVQITGIESLRELINKPNANKDANNQVKP